MTDQMEQLEADINNLKSELNQKVKDIFQKYGMICEDYELLSMRDSIDDNLPCYKLNEQGQLVKLPYTGDAITQLLSCLGKPIPTK